MSFEIMWRREGDEQTLLTATTVDGREVVVAATADHAIGIWDAADGTPAGKSHTGLSHVFGLASTVLDGRPVVASLGLKGVPPDIVEEFFDGNEDFSEVGMISVWDPATGEELGTPIVDDGEMDATDVVGLTATTDGGPPLLIGIIGNEIAAGCVVTWSIQTRQQEEGFPSDWLDRVTYIDAMAPVLLDGRQAVVAMISREHFDETSGGRYELCTWNGRTGDVIGEPWSIRAAERDVVLAATVLSGRSMAALWAAGHDHIRLHWLPAGGTAGALPIADAGRPELFRAGYLGDAAILAAAHTDGVITIWDLTTHERRATLTGLATVNDLLLTANGVLVAATDSGLTAVRL